MLTISGRGLGQRRALFEDFSVPPPDETGEGGPLTLRDLISHVVRSEVATFQQRREHRGLDRVLSRGEIERQEKRGRISPEGRDPRYRRGEEVNADSAVETALEAFVDGLYLVIIDELEYRDLEAIVRLHSESRVTFLRLTFLAGA